MVAALGGARDGKLSVRMKGAVAARRRDHDRAVVGRAQNIRAHVDLADVDQPARAQGEFAEALPIGAQRDFVVGAGRHVAEMRRRHVLLHHRLEIEDVDRLARVLDQFVEVARCPFHRVG
jgi:hypothetical protein